MVYKVSDKRTSATRANKFSAGAIKNENMSNKQLAKELHKPIIRKLNKIKRYSFFIDNIWGADVADLEIFLKEFSFY